MSERLRVLIVCSGNKGRINPFILEQGESLKTKGVDISYFTIHGKGIVGYIRNFFRFRSLIHKNSFDIVHAHYGLSGFMTVLQRTVPVVITFHGSDVNNPKILRYSRWAARKAAYNIIVEKGFADKLGVHSNVLVLPCGINMHTFIKLSKAEARNKMHLPLADNLVLFTSAFENPVKNYPLAKQSVQLLQDTTLLELKGYSREQINLLMNAADALLLTSFSEGSPQVVKEALACDLPVVSTPVGDVKQLIEGIEGNYIVPYDAEAIAGTLKRILEKKERVSGRHKMKAFDNELVADKLISVYKTIVRK